MIRFFPLHIITLFFTLMVSFSTLAVEVTDLYQASVEVPSQSSQDRRRGIKQAMMDILIKVSGQKSIKDNTILQQAMNQPDNYFLQYRYENNQQALNLVVDFDQDKINQLFKQAQQPLWGSLRPQVLIWLINEEKLARNIIASSSESVFALRIKQLAKQRGLPVILPLMDLEEATNISTSEVWGRFAEPVMESSSRYQPEKIVIIRISDHSLVDSIEAPSDCLVCQQQVVVDWSIIEDQQLFSQPYKGNDTNELLAQVVDDITEHIYQQYASSTSTNNEFYIDVNNINSLSQDVKLYEFLESLSSIQEVMLTQVKGQHRRFKLMVLGSKESLLASFKLSAQLTQQIDPLAANHVDDIPLFHWQE